MDWTDQAQCLGHVAGAFEFSNESSGSIKCGKFMIGWVYINFSRRALLHGISNWRIIKLNTSHIQSKTHKHHVWQDILILHSLFQKFLEG